MKNVCTLPTRRVSLPVSPTTLSNTMSLAPLPPLSLRGSLPPLKSPLSLAPLGGAGLALHPAGPSTPTARRDIRQQKLGIQYHKPTLLLYYTVPPQSRRVRRMPLRQVQACVEARATGRAERVPTADEVVGELLGRHAKYLGAIKREQVGLALLPACEGFGGLG